MADPGGDVVELHEPTAIRAIAHPARLLVIEALYDHGRELTATQAAALAGTTPSAMSYHLRALERAGIVRRSTSSDGRERPWVRAGKDLRISLASPGNSHASALATGAVLSSAIETTRQRLLAAIERSAAAGAAKEGLDGVINFTHTAVLVTPEEARDLLVQLNALIQPWRLEERADRPEAAGLLNVLLVATPDELTRGDPPPDQGS